MALFSLHPYVKDLRTLALYFPAGVMPIIMNDYLLPILKVLECSGTELSKIDAFTELVKRRTRRGVPEVGDIGLIKTCCYV